MAKVLRKIIRIDENLCNGCGLCIPECPEGALQIIDGKARLVKESLCDGLGACIGHCPQGAITIEEKEAEEFDEKAAMQMVKQRERRGAAESAHFHGLHLQEAFGCPSSQTKVFSHTNREVSNKEGSIESRLAQWPVQLALVAPEAPYFKKADLLIAADCVPFAYADFHRDFLEGKTLLIGCPKLDDMDFYTEKLAQIFSLNELNSITIVHMEVPCCFGLKFIVKQALAISGASIPVEDIVVSIQGKVKEEV
jgi:NAD-dependent dihydropyrimidine dehydrogenase PreA subunit